MEEAACRAPVGVGVEAIRGQEREFLCFLGVLMYYSRDFNPKTDPKYNLTIMLRPDFYKTIGY